MNRKLNFLLAFVLTLITIGTIQSQTTGPLGKLLLEGDILFTTENNTVEKKKEVKDTKVFMPQQAIYATFYTNLKLKTHSLFYKDNNRLYVKLNISVKGGESTQLEFDLKPDDKEKKSSCFEFAPAVLIAENANHRKLASLFGDLKPGVYTVNVSLDDGKSVSGKLDLDLSGGTGKYGDFNKKIKEEEARVAAETKKKNEEEQKKRNAAVKAFQSSADIVKVAFKNKCENPGNLYVSTGDGYTSFNLTVNGGGQSDYVICRPGNKVYLGNDIIHTVSAASKNKVIEFCGPKTEAQLKEESFQTGWESITVSIYNKCGSSLYYLVEQGGSTLNTSLNGNSSTSSPSMKKGNKIWLSNDKYEKVSLIYEASSYSEKGIDVFLCR